MHEKIKKAGNPNMKQPVYTNPPCPYCGEKSVFNIKNGYGKYECKPCGASVGVHPSTKKPLGTLANERLRFWRSRAHWLFDPLWQSNKLTRTQAYSWLQEKMQLSAEDCHIGIFNLEQCKLVCTYSISKQKDLKLI